MNQNNSEISVNAPSQNDWGLYFSVGLTALLLSFFSGLIYFAYSLPTKDLSLSASPDPFFGIELSAKAAYVWDMKDGMELYSLNGDQTLPLASLTKVMTALVAVEMVGENNVVVVGPDAFAEDGDSGLFTWERWRFKDLLNFTLITSSNDGASAIAAFAGSQTANSEGTPFGRDGFVGLMNKKASELDLTNTRFYNENGLDLSATKGGGYGSAKDVAKLFEYILKDHPEILSATVYDSLRIRSLDNIVHVARNTNTALGGIPGVLASKTGYTDLSDGNLALAFDVSIGHPVVLVVLGSTYDGRFEDILKLQKATMEKYRLSSL